MDWASASEIARAVSDGERSAISVTEAALARIGKLNPKLNAFTGVVADRARKKARALDQARGEGKPLGPLAGVPFAVKNLFDVAGLATLAGSKINRDHAPSARDATLVERLEAAGAVLVGALNMGEYAYDFTGENVHDGPSRNPHDLEPHDRRLLRRLGRRGRGRTRAAGARLRHQRLDPRAVVVLRHLRAQADLRAAVAGAHVSVRVEPSIISARSRATRLDLALSYDAMQGADPDDPVCADRPRQPVTPLLARGIDGLRIAVAGGYFRKGASPETQRGDGDRRQGARRHARNRNSRSRARAFRGLRHHRDRGRGAASRPAPHARERLRSRGSRPADRGRDGAGGAGQPGAEIPPLVPRRRCSKLFDGVDVILAPATPCTAPKIGQQTFVLDGVEMPLRPNIGIYTQPISFIGLPVVAAPVPLQPLPIAVQIIAAPWREDLALAGRPCAGAGRRRAGAAAEYLGQQR